MPDDPATEEAVLAPRRAMLIERFHAARLPQTLGMRLTYDEAGRAHVRLPYRPAHDHALGDTHGGILATLLDTAGWFTLAPHYATWIATVEFSTRLDEPANRQDLEAVGTGVRMGKRVAMAQMEVHAADGRLVARGAGTFAPTRLGYDAAPPDRPPL